MSVPDLLRAPDWLSGHISGTVLALKYNQIKFSNEECVVVTVFMHDVACIWLIRSSSPSRPGTVTGHVTLTQGGASFVFGFVLCSELFRFWFHRALLSNQLLILDCFGAHGRAPPKISYLTAVQLFLNSRYAVSVRTWASVCWHTHFHHRCWLKCAQVTSQVYLINVNGGWSQPGSAHGIEMKWHWSAGRMDDDAVCKAD